jgi:hypothetical protein
MHHASENLARSDVPLVRALETVVGMRLPDVQFERRPLRGGLTAPSVEHVVARFEDARGKRRSFGFVLKVLEGDAVREAQVYEQLLSSRAGGLAPRLLGVMAAGTNRVALLLEAVPKARAWPWRDVTVTRGVLELAARLHDTATRRQGALGWDYDAELQSVATATLESLEQCRSHPDLRALRAYVAPCKRLVLALPVLRHELLTHSLGAVPIHGDLHPGNVIVRALGGGTTPVLLDWERARMGAPFEDVSSWLQSLGYWEPEVRRRHDTLLASYLAARGETATLSSDVRGAYWLAGASNAFAGALRYHLAMAQAAESGAHRAKALHAAKDWLRVIRRADAVWS